VALLKLGGLNTFAFKSLMGGFDVFSVKMNVGSGLRMLEIDEWRIREGMG
jgi:hypothetical protein